MQNKHSLILPDITTKLRSLSEELRNLSPFNVTDDIILVKNRENLLLQRKLTQTIIEMMKLIDSPTKLMGVGQTPLEKYIGREFVKEIL